MKKERAETRALFPEKEKPLADEAIQDNRKTLLKQLHALDSDKDVIAPFGISTAKKKSRHRRVMSARTSHVDQIIT